MGAVTAGDVVRLAGFVLTRGAPQAGNHPLPFVGKAQQFGLALDGDPKAKADELAVLSRRLAATGDDLDRLRAILEPLLLHARALRAAAIEAAAS